MKDFARSRGRLRSLSLHARLAYTIFLGFTAAAFVLTAWLLNDMVGLRMQRVASYYAGAPLPAAAAPSPRVEPKAAVAGPVVELPDEVAAGTMAAEAMPRRKLLEVTHFHLFTMPVYLLILSHLFMLSRTGSRFKTTTILAATAGTGLHVAAPWAATTGSAFSIALYAVSGTMLGISYFIMCVVPIWEMWMPDSAATSSQGVVRPLSETGRAAPESVLG